MRVIFLDIDGVLNIMSPSYNTSKYRNGEISYIEPHLITRLEWLIAKTNADIVISSSWRADMEDLRMQMERSGFGLWDRVIDRTGSMSTARWRGDQIQMWLSRHSDVEAYVVLEDEPIDVCGVKCDTIDTENVIEVNMDTGLTHEDVVRAKRILCRDI